MESSIFGVSVRAWLALTTVVSGLVFLYSAFFLAEGQQDVIVTSIVGFIGLALGYYLGQKSMSSTSDTTTTTTTTNDASNP